MREKNDEKIKLSDFEKNLKRLEEIVTKLEKGEMSLEESLKLFEEGIKLARICEKALTEAERRVEILIRNEQGEMEPRPFTAPIENEQSRNDISVNAKTNSKDISPTPDGEKDIEGDLPF